MVVVPTDSRLVSTAKTLESRQLSFEWNRRLISVTGVVHPASPHQRDRWGADPVGSGPNGSALIDEPCSSAGPPNNLSGEVSGQSRRRLERPAAPVTLARPTDTTPPTPTLRHRPH
ncbi:hypothetical protein GCM10027416_25790 [Okibacterium endophyticum]